MQEERFMKKRDELNARIRELEREKRRFDSHLQAAKDAQARAEQDIVSLTQDMTDIQQQVAPMVELVEKARDSAQAARVLSHQRERMFRSLVARARAVADRLGAKAPVLSVEGNADAATYLGFFEQLLTSLEEVVTSLDDLVDNESRELLGVAVGQVFANLAHLHPGFDFASVMEPLEKELASKLDASVWDDVEKYTQRFKRVEVEESDDEAGAEEVDDEDIDGDDENPAA